MPYDDAPYVVVTPVRDEAEYLRHTIASMLSQTRRPQQWVLVDDGSTDETPTICREYSQREVFIAFVSRPRREDRRPGGGVVEAFSEGYAALTDTGWSFLVKLDGDVSFDAGYFESCLRRFNEDPRLGIAGGAIAVPKDEGVTIECPYDPPFHVRGACKIYRRECWHAIGGLVPMTGWDTIDEVKANMLGWRTMTLADNIVLHHRPTGSTHGQWKDCFKCGHANYVCGYHPLFMLAKAARRFLLSWEFRDAFGLMCGYLNGYLSGMPRLSDKDFIRYIRRQQKRALTFRSSLWSGRTSGTTDRRK